MATSKTTAKAAESAPEKATAEIALNTPKYCRCGCGVQVRRQFATGHDARHISNLRKAVMAGTITAEAAQHEASSCSDALGRKMQRGLELLAEAATKADPGKASAAQTASAQADGKAA